MTDRKRLERILDVKERIREVRRGELATAERAVEDAERDAQDASMAQRSAIDSLVEPGLATGADLASKAVIVALAARTAKHARSALEERIVEREERAETVFSATREVRALETLNRRLIAREEAHERNREQRETDDAAGRAGVGR